VLTLYLFDLDGTLLDAGRAGRIAFDATAEQLYGWRHGSHGVRFGGGTDPGILNAMFAKHGWPRASHAQWNDFVAAYVPNLEAALQAAEVQALDGAAEALAWAEGQPGAVVGIATGNIRQGAIAKLRRAGLRSHFAVAGYGCDAEDRAEMVGIAIERGRAAAAGRVISRVVVVGDTVHDISAARAHGAIAVAVTTGSDSADALAHADIVTPSLRSFERLPLPHR
jgi:phosphoglycolate phosphatase-like HAD superfamily hydrolase